MEEIKRQRRRSMLILGAALLLIVTGTVLINRVINLYSMMIQEDKDADHMDLTYSLDPNIAGYIERYSESLAYVVQRRGFQSAEDIWKSTGDTEELLFRLNENLLIQDELVTAMVSVYNNEIILSTDGRRDYFFPPNAGRSDEISVRPCISGDGRIYLAFVFESSSGISHAALMDLENFYETMTANLRGREEGRITLLDAGGHIVIHNSPDGTHINYIEDMNESSCDYMGVILLDNAQKTGTPAVEFYDTVDGQTDGKRYRARITMLPAAASSNQVFSIGVSVNYDVSMRPLRMASIRLLAYGSMVAVGVVLMFAVFVWMHQKGSRELKLLYKKNEAMEELNRKTMELAHHQRLETIGTLTSSISHEFNNLLTPIMGYSLLTLENLPDEENELYDYVLEIYNASQKAKTIISRLSDLSRKNSAMTFHFAQPDELVRRALEVAKPAQPLNVEVHTCPGCKNAWLHCNEIQMSQMLLNLILNGFQAMEKEGGVLDISTYTEEKNICIRVADTGPGIPKDVMPHLFEPFYTTKEGGRGTGLGLAIVQQVLEDHHGTIRVTSTVGEGACFIVSLPEAAKK